jgi:prolipoprotein diacylglyceryl transferase
VIASIPSPSSGSIDIGPLSLNAYGLMIAIGIIAAVWLCGRRFEERGVGTREDASAIALWAVLAGVIGARLYHVLTDWERFEGRYGDIPKIWEGGLGIPGAMFAGLLVGVWVARRRGIATDDALACGVPAIPLGQAIGRWGNWWNQELFGRPTNLPWALEIDDEHLPAGYASGTTFHPTFLYESLWNFALCGLLLWIDARYRPTGKRLLAMYLLGYGIGRFWIEGLRIDKADEIGPFRWNQWVALALIVCGGAYLLFGPRRPAPAVASGSTTLDHTADAREVAEADAPVDEHDEIDDHEATDGDVEADENAGVPADELEAADDGKAPTDELEALDGGEAGDDTEADVDAEADVDGDVRAERPWPSRTGADESEADSGGRPSPSR